MRKTSEYFRFILVKSLEFDDNILIGAKQNIYFIITT